MTVKPQMSRAVRTARGLGGAVAVTLLAATSHGIAGGEITALAVIAVAVLSLPLFVLLAGRLGSLWRLALAVVPAQFLYHWSFAGLGLATERGSAGAADAVASSPHAAHLEALSFVPALAEAGAADMWMWVSHAVAAVLSIALLHRGEQAAIQLARVLRHSLPLRLPQAVQLPKRRAILAPSVSCESHRQLTFLSATRYRGPPAHSGCSLLAM